MDKPPKYAAIIGQNLRRVRVHRGLAQRQISHALGLARPAVTLIESGARPATVDELIALAVFYRTSLTDVILHGITTECFPA